jgi:hypothetical protein
MNRRLAPVLLSLWPALSVAQSEIPDTLACVRAQLPEQATMTIEARTADAEGIATQQRARAAYRRGERRSEISLRVESPADLAGTAYLIRRLPADNSTYLYLPAVGHVQRLHGASGGKVLGTSLSADDVRHLLTGFADGTVSLGPRGQVHAWSTRRLYIVPAADAAPGAYDKIEVEITDPGCVVVESRFYLDNRLRKRITAAADSLREQDRYRYASRLEVQIPNETMRSEITILALDPRPSPPDALFAPERFYQPIR